VESAHPIPDARSVRAAVQLTRLLETVNENDTALFLISGGGSSLLTQPVDTVTLEDLQKLTDILLKNGAAIHEINILRRHVDKVKGGGLLRVCRSKHMLAFLLSDVIGNRLEDIASGPTAADPSTFQDAWAIVEKYRIQESVPGSILRHLELGCQGKMPETVKPSEAVTHNIQNIILADNRSAAEAAVKQAGQEGFDAAHLTSELGGDASLAGQYLADELRKALPAGRPVCIVEGGETTVRVEGNGLGGRNLEVALGAVRGMDGLPSAALVTLATDGEDGPTDAAGAVVTGDTLSRSVLHHLEIERFLKNHDSYHFFKALNDLIRTGPTHTNVNDLNFLFAF